MKFGKHVQRHVLPLLSSNPLYSYLHASVLPYKDLKQMLKTVDFATYRARGSEAFAEEECCGICLDPLTLRCDAIRTRCGHLFHAWCVVDAFGVRTSRGECPLCRTGLSRMVPLGLDGDVLRFLATVRVGIDTADACYEQFVRYLQASVNVLIAGAATQTPFFALHRWFSSARADLLHRASELCAHLAAARVFALANRDGVRKIVKKLERRARSPAPLASTHVVEAWLSGRGFVRDQVEGGGRLGEMRRRLAAMFGDLFTGFAAFPNVDTR